MTSTLPTTEGEVAFDVPEGGKPVSTWYKIIGSLEGPTPPLIALHGGPGAGHEYLTSLIDLYESYDIPVVFYDQIGCGRSTHFREKMGDQSFWTVDLFIRELDNLIDHLGLRKRGFYILGHSWGGLLGGAYISKRPEGLIKAVLASGPSSIPLYVEGTRKLLAQLPEDIKQKIEECEAKEDYESEEYEKASEEFLKRHLCRLDSWPEPLQEAFKNLKDDPTAYMTMQGPSEFTVIGNIKNWEGWSKARNINVEVLLTNGHYDEVQDLSIEPWFENIPKVEWVKFKNSSHVPHWEEKERFNHVVGTFLTSRRSYKN